MGANLGEHSISLTPEEMSSRAEPSHPYMNGRQKPPLHSLKTIRRR